MRSLAVVLLVLFPFLILFYANLAFVSLGAAIVLLYVSATRPAGNRRRAPVEKAPAPQQEWKDPWNTDGVGQ